MQVNLASKFSKATMTPTASWVLAVETVGWGWMFFSQYAGVRICSQTVEGQVGLLEVDHLDIKGFQVNNGKDSRFRN